MSEEPQRPRRALSREARIAARSGLTSATFIRKNYILGIVNGSFGRFRESLLDPSTVMALLVLYLTKREDLAGILFTAGILGLALPQIFMPGVADAMPRKRPLYTLSAIARTITMSAMCVLMFFLDVWPPMLVFILLVVLTAMISFSVGLGLLAFFDIVAKTIPHDLRGRFMALRWFWGGAMGLSGGFFVRYMLKQEQSGIPLTRAFQIIMVMATLVGIICTVAFCFVDDPESKVARRKGGIVTQIRRGFQYLRVDRNLWLFTVLRFALAVSGCAVLYLGLYWKNTLGLDPAAFGYFIVARVLGELATVMTLGRFSDRKGNRRTIILSVALHVAVCPLVLAATFAPAHWESFDARFWIYIALYVLIGIGGSGLAISITNYPLEIAPAQRRPTYMGIIFVTNALFAFIPGALGLLLPVMGYGGFFGICFAGSIAAVLIATQLQEPRKGLTMMPGESGRR